MNHLDSPNHSGGRNNGNLESSVGPQPRYAAFTRGSGRGSHHYDRYHHHQQPHHWQPQLPDELDEEEDEFTAKYTKDSICWQYANYYPSSADAAVTGVDDNAIETTV